MSMSNLRFGPPPTVRLPFEKKEGILTAKENVKPVTTHLELSAAKTAGCHSTHKPIVNQSQDRLTAMRTHIMQKKHSALNPPPNAAPGNELLAMLCSNPSQAATHPHAHRSAAHASSPPSAEQMAKSQAELALARAASIRTADRAAGLDVGESGWDALCRADYKYHHKVAKRTAAGPSMSHPWDRGASGSGCSPRHNEIPIEPARCVHTAAERAACHFERLAKANAVAQKVGASASDGVDGDAVAPTDDESVGDTVAATTPKSWASMCHTASRDAAQQRADRAQLKVPHRTQREWYRKRCARARTCGQSLNSEEALGSACVHEVEDETHAGEDPGRHVGVAGAFNAQRSSLVCATGRTKQHNLKDVCRQILRRTKPGQSHRAALLDALVNWERGTTHKEPRGTKRILRGGAMTQADFVLAMRSYTGLREEEWFRQLFALAERGATVRDSSCYRGAENGVKCSSANSEGGAWGGSAGADGGVSVSKARECEDGNAGALIAAERLVRCIMQLGRNDREGCQNGVDYRFHSVSSGGARFGGGTFEFAPPHRAGPTRTRHGAEPGPPLPATAMGCILPTRNPQNMAMDGGLSGAWQTSKARVRRTTVRNSARMPGQRQFQLLAKRWRAPGDTYGACEAQRRAILQALRAFDGACAGPADWENTDYDGPVAPHGAPRPSMPRKWLAIERRDGLNRAQFCAALRGLFGQRDYRTAHEEWQVDIGCANAPGASDVGETLSKADADLLFDQLLIEGGDEARDNDSELVAIEDVCDAILRWQAYAIAATENTSEGGVGACHATSSIPFMQKSSSGRDDGNDAQLQEQDVRAFHNDDADSVIGRIAQFGRAFRNRSGEQNQTAQEQEDDVSKLEGLLAVWAVQSRALQVPWQWTGGASVHSQTTWTRAFGCENLLAGRRRRPWIGCSASESDVAGVGAQGFSTSEPGEGLEANGFTIRFVEPQQISAVVLRQCNWNAGGANGVPFATGKVVIEGCSMENGGKDIAWTRLCAGKLSVPTTEWRRDGADAEPAVRLEVLASALELKCMLVRVRAHVLQLPKAVGQQRRRPVLAPGLAQCDFIPRKLETNPAVARPHTRAQPALRFSESLEEAGGLAGHGEGACDPRAAGGQGLLDFDSFRRALRSFLSLSEVRASGRVSIAREETEHSSRHRVRDRACDTAGRAGTCVPRRREHSTVPRIVRRGESWGIDSEPRRSCGGGAHKAPSVAMAADGLDDYALARRLFDEIIDQSEQPGAANTSKRDAAMITARAAAKAFLRHTQPCNGNNNGQNINSGPGGMTEQLLERIRARVSSSGMMRRAPEGTFWRRAHTRDKLLAKRTGRATPTSSDIEGVIGDAFALFAARERDMYPQQDKLTELRLRGLRMQRELSRDGADQALSLGAFCSALRHFLQSDVDLSAARQLFVDAGATSSVDETNCGRGKLRVSDFAHYIANALG